MDILPGSTINCDIDTLNKYEEYLSKEQSMKHILENIEDEMYIMKVLFTDTHKDKMLRRAKYFSKEEAVSNFLQTMSKYFVNIEYDPEEKVFRVL